MKANWKMKVRRVTAFLLTLLISAGMVPYGTIKVVAAPEEKAAGTVQVVGKVVTEEESGTTTGYAQAAVSILEEKKQEVGTGTTADDGSFTIDCADWVINENDVYYVKVSPKEGDAYEVYESGALTVTADNVADSKITLDTEIKMTPVLAPVLPTYTITVNGTAGGTVEVSDQNPDTDSDGENIPEGETRTILAEPDAGYEITAVTVTKGSADTPWTPDGTPNADWWKDCVQDGKFEYSLEGIEDNYAFSVVFEKQTFEISYTISAKGKLTLNSGAADEQDKIVIEAADSELSDKSGVSYTEAPYKITAALTDNNYHLTSFVVDGTEQIKADEIVNDLDNREYTFESGITGSHSITVTAEIDQYTVSIVQTEIENEYGRGNGTVTVNGAELINDAVTVDCGESVTLLITPAEESQISEITVDGMPVDPDASADIKDHEDGSYEYTVSGVARDTTLEVKFAPVSRTNTALDQYNISLKNEKGEVLIPDAVNTCYAETVTVTAENPGDRIRIDNKDKYKTSITLTDSQNLETLYLRKKGIFGINKETKITINPPIALVIDTIRPEITLAESEIYKNGNAKEATISGTVKEENLAYVVCANQEMNPDDLKTTPPQGDGIDVLIDFVGTEQEFSVTRKLAEGKNVDTFYLYAVDKAGHCSDEAAVTVKRDGTAPEITGFAVKEEPNDCLKKYAFGNFANTTLTFTIEANDDAGTDENPCPAAGIQKVRIYAENNETYCYGNEISSKVSEGNSAKIEVTVEIGEAESFIDLSTLYIVAEDSVGNVSKPYKISDIANHPADIKSDKLMLENYAPKTDITLNVSEGSKYTENPDTPDKKIWYGEIPEISYTVTEGNGVLEGKGSGLAKRHVYLNGTELKSKTDYTDGIIDYADIPQDENGVLTETDLGAMVQGENTLAIQFVDLAGNESTTTEELYLDTSAPQITGFSLVQNQSPLEKFINFLSFGNFANGTVEITVTAEDTKDKNDADIPSAGLKEITLYLDGPKEKIEKTSSVTQLPDGKVGAVFTLPAEKILTTEEKVYLDAVVTAVARDNVGNVSDECDMTTGNSNIEDSHLMIETVKPVVDVKILEEGYKNPEGTIYNNTDTAIDVVVQDVDSGLRSVAVSINGTMLEDVYMLEKDTGAVKTWKCTVNTKDAAKHAEVDGLYEICVTAVDNAGNAIEKTVKNVYKDETAPQITRYEMQAAGTVEADGLPCTEEDYGYYFHEDTKVTIYATDGTKKSDCGVKEIHYYTIDADGTKSSETAVPVDAEGKASFIIKAEYKGQIYAKAYDYLDNTPENFVAPNALVIETNEQHAKEEHIAYEKQTASYKDNNGKDLYADNVNVDVTVTDTFSGIRSVEWFVEAPQDTAANQHGTVEVDNAGEFVSGSNAEGWKRTKADKNLVTELKKTISVSNNSNDIKIKIIMTDRAGNASEKEMEFSIDKTIPVIKLAFDNESPDSENAQMYKDNRIATITVTERNFNPEEIKVNITNEDGTVPGLSNWVTSVNTSNPDETVSTATVTFSEDGDYTLEVSGKDKAGNVAETVKAKDFTIDKTKPIITVTYDNENPMNGNYFAAERTATIQIEEHNFSSDRVQIIGTATNGEAAITFPTVGGWSGNGDIHTATILCGADGLYRFDVKYTDMAGNEAEEYNGEEYYVDMTEPEIEITGVENLSANNGDVIPRITLSDMNYDANGVNIELVGANQGNVTPDGAYTAQGNGQIFTFSNFPKEQAYDDIYTINATLTDMAGNESTETITFSVNRFGSVYVFDNSLKEIEGTYIQNEIDVKLTEVNVDSLEHDKIRVVVDANGTPRDLSEGTDYTVQETGGNGSWYRYDYTINKELFSNDGRYIVSLYSEDVAGNINENIAAAKEAEINFGVDKTAPVVVPIDLESNTQYPVDVKSATVSVNDNLVLDSVEIYVGEQKCDYETDGENYTFRIPSASEKQDVSVCAVDAAGNRTNYIINGVLVTTNLLVRWYNNKLVFAGSLAGVAAAAGGGIGLGFALKSGRIKVKRKKK